MARHDGTSPGRGRDRVPAHGILARKQLTVKTNCFRHIIRYREGTFKFNPVSWSVSDPGIYGDLFLLAIVTGGSAAVKLREKCSAGGLPQVTACDRGCRVRKTASFLNG